MRVLIERRDRERYLAVQMHWVREILILSANKCSHGSRAEVLQAQALLPSNTHNFPGGSRT